MSKRRGETDESRSMINDRLIPERHAEERLGFSNGTFAVKRSRRDMFLPVVRVGTRIMYRLSDIDAYVLANTTVEKATDP